MTRGEVWLAAVGGKTRPVVVLTRAAVIDFRSFVTVAEITSSVRGIRTEVSFDLDSAGVDRDSVVNCDGLYTVPRASLASRLGVLDDSAMARLCGALNYALGC